MSTSTTGRTPRSSRRTDQPGASSRGARNRTHHRSAADLPLSRAGFVPAGEVAGIPAAAAPGM
eukprot:5374205-Lingulodinium_polyedra.AAC.1